MGYCVIDYFIELYRAFLKVKALGYGMPREDAEEIDSLCFPEDLLALIEFLVDCYQADRDDLIGFMKPSAPSLHLAPGEYYNEWEMP
jgi:hypothetical protein